MSLGLLSMRGLASSRGWVPPRGLAAFAVVLLALTLQMGLSTPGQAEAPYRVVTTTGMIADAAKYIAGDDFEVTALIDPAVDPHTYRQTRSDIALMTKADLVLYHGLYLEAQLEDFLRKLARRTKVVAVAEAIPQNQLIAHEDYEGKFDPHVWMDPDLWSVVVRRICDGLAELAPAKRNALQERADIYLAAMQGISNYSQQTLATVPERSRILLTAHDAFGYFGRAYGFEVIGIQGISTESEAGLTRISELVDLLVARNIGAVFVESSVSDRNVRAITEGAAAKGHRVLIGGELFSDAMGQLGTYEGTYLGMIDHNATLITKALGGIAPDGGFQGRLMSGS